MNLLLPEHYIIKRVPGSTLWIKYIRWINNTQNTNWSGKYKYYGAQGGEFHFGNSEMEFDNQTKIITLEEWDSIVNGIDHKDSEKERLSGF